MKEYISKIWYRWDEETYREGEAKRNGHLIAAAPHRNHALDFVARQAMSLIKRGIYEQALSSAYVLSRTNNSMFEIVELEYIFHIADRQKLLAQGKPLPAVEEVTIYRGVSGRGKHRKVRSFSWTTDLDVACWFAEQDYFNPGVNVDPAVYTATVKTSDILINIGGGEKEIVVRPKRCSRMKLTGEDIKAGCQRNLERRHAAQLAESAKSNTAVAAVPELSLAG